MYIDYRNISNFEAKAKDMPKDLPLLSEMLPRFYRNQFFETLVWVWVTALSHHNNISKESAIRSLQEYLGLSEDDLSTESMRKAYQRRCKELRHANKTLSIAEMITENAVMGEHVSDNNEGDGTHD